MNIETVEHKVWIKRSVSWLRDLQIRGVTHIRVKPSKGFGYEWSQSTVERAIEQLTKKDVK